MKKEEKRNLILESIIDAYLLDNSPIGSSDLNLKMDIPASTIRVYLKSLDDDGLISKLHVSGGRIPTIFTMQEYWKKNLNKNDDLNINNDEFLYCLANEYKIYCLIYGGRDLILQDICILNNKFIVLDFIKNELVIKFDKNYYEFIKQFIGFDLFNIEKIAYKVKFIELLQKIYVLKNDLIYFRANEKRAYQIYQNDEFVKLLDSNIDVYFKDNLEFEPLFKEGFMGLKVDATYKGEAVNILFAGSIYANYKKMLDQIKEVA